MSADIAATLASLPPGTDIFLYLENSIESQIWPELTKAFWIQGWITVGLEILVFTAFTAGLIIRHRQGRLKLWVYDGAMTRPDPRVWIPILWSIYSILILGLFLWIRQSLKHHSYSASLGRYWWMAHVPLVISYALYSVSVICSAPPVRRMLSQINERSVRSRGLLPSVMILNSTLFVYCCALAVGIAPAASKEGHFFQTINDVGKGALDIVRRASLASDLASLYSLGPFIRTLDSTNDFKAAQVGGSVYFAYICVFLMSAVVPAFTLNSLIRKRIAKLENGDATDPETMYPALPKFPVTLPPASATSPSSIDDDALVKSRIPRDAPFANIVQIQVSAVPARFQDIIEARIDNFEKARRLKAVMRQDIQNLFGYFLLLLTFGALELFQACNGTKYMDLNQKQSTMVLYSWVAWNFLIPGVLVSMFFLYTSIRNQGDFAPEIEAKPMEKHYRNHVTAITLTQDVQVVEEIQLQEKSTSRRASELYYEN